MILDKNKIFHLVRNISLTNELAANMFSYEEFNSLEDSEHSKLNSFIEKLNYQEATDLSKMLSKVFDKKVAPPGLIDNGDENNPLLKPFTKAQGVTDPIQPSLIEHSDKNPLFVLSKLLGKLPYIKTAPPGMIDTDEDDNKYPKPFNRHDGALDPLHPAELLEIEERKRQQKVDLYIREFIRKVGHSENSDMELSDELKKKIEEERIKQERKAQDEITAKQIEADKARAEENRQLEIRKREEAAEKAKEAEQIKDDKLRLEKEKEAYRAGQKEQEAKRAQEAESKRIEITEKTKEKVEESPTRVFTRTSGYRENSEAHKRGAIDIRCHDISSEERHIEASAISQNLGSHYLVIVEERHDFGQTDTHYRNGKKTKTEEKDTDHVTADGIHTHIQPNKWW